MHSLQSFLLFMREALRALSQMVMIIICLSLGVIGISAVGHLSQALQSAIARDAKVLLGGDLMMRVSLAPLKVQEEAYLAARATRMVKTQSLQTMIRRADDGTPSNAPNQPLAQTLVELKAIDNLYPTYGTVSLSPTFTRVQDALTGGAGRGIVVQQQLADRLGVTIGDKLKIGDLFFTLRAILMDYPDKSTGRLQLGPRVIISTQDLAATGLVTEGSLIHYFYHLALPAGDDAVDDAVQLENDFRAAFPGAGGRFRGLDNAMGGFNAGVERFESFLVLISLSVLLTAGIGVGNAVSNWLHRRRVNIATLKVLGYRTRDLWAIHLTQLMMVALIACLPGTLLGALLPVFANDALAQFLPVTLHIGLYPQPIAVAFIFGLLTVFIFALIPLERAMKSHPVVLFRGDDEGDTLPPVSPTIKLSVAGLIALLVLLTCLIFDDYRLIAWFGISVTLAFLLFYAMAGGVVWLLRQVSPRGLYGFLWLRQLTRRDGHTRAMLISIGMGLVVLVASSQIEQNIHANLSNVSDTQAPSFFLLNITNDNIEAFRAFNATRDDVVRVDSTPMLRGFFTHMNEIPISDITVPSDQAWVVRGDRGITWQATRPENAEVVEGKWWPEEYNGPPLISFGEEAARAFGLGIGDTITMRILGREVTGTIHNLRRIDWTEFGINFVVVFSPGLLDKAPQSHLASVYLHQQHDSAYEKALAIAFPDVSVIRMKEMIREIQIIFGKLIIAVRILALFAIITGIVVLIGVVAADQERRRRESAVMQVLGLSPLAYVMESVMEFVICGGLSMMLALVIGSLASFGVVAFFFDQDFVLYNASLLWLPPLVLAVVALIGFAVSYAGSKKSVTHYLAP